MSAKITDFRLIDFKLRNTIRDKAIEAVILVIAYGLVRRVKPSMVADYSWLVAVELVAVYLLFGVLWAFKTWRSSRATAAAQSDHFDSLVSGIQFGPPQAPPQVPAPSFVDPNPTVATEAELRSKEEAEPKP